MRVLALDTTTAYGAVALVDDGQVEAEVRVRAPTGHSSRVLPAVAYEVTVMDRQEDASFRIELKKR